MSKQDDENGLDIGDGTGWTRPVYLAEVGERCLTVPSALKKLQRTINESDQCPFAWFQIRLSNEKYFKFLKTNSFIWVNV